MKMRRPCRAAISSITSGMIGPEEISTTPRPRPPIAPTSASNSEMSLIVDGIGTPPQPEWFSEYEAPRPTAPPTIASATSRFISASSAAVGSWRSEASSPITAVRTAECPTNTPRLI